MRGKEEILIAIQHFFFFSKNDLNAFFLRVVYYEILDLTKLKAFADDKLKVAKMRISLFDRVENTVGKGENAGNQHFLLFQHCFPKPSSVG